MSSKRANTAEIDFKISLWRNGKRMENSEGKYELAEYVKGFEIIEAVESSTIEARIIIEDSSGLMGALTGSEVFKLTVFHYTGNRDYWLRCAHIEDRVRTAQTADVFIVNCVSDEFIKNEIKNVFGHTEKIFAGSIEASQIIRKLLRDKKYLGSKKRFFLEQTINKQRLVIPNWRPIDVVYWVAERSVRKSKKGGVLQNGFNFWESALGFHFKSIDKMIDDVNEQKEDKTDAIKGKPALYTYTYSPKGTKIETGDDQYKIDSVIFPEERSYLMGLRHGAWAGYSIGFDPVSINQSRLGVSTDMKEKEYNYALKKVWKKMSHVGGTNYVNPISLMDKEIQKVLDQPKRVRYTMIPNQLFDPKYKNNPQKNYEEIVELQAYEYLRRETLKNIKLMITIPGNLDLYAGHGVQIKLPGTFRSGTTVQNDRKYSGRYVIMGVRHHTGDGLKMKTELLLGRDSILG
ncbi:MAG: hypothetical protein CL557_11520 [Alphaproteobacteria bacterium]|mgnify:FL=1|nr:hypothetical protein [Alphaproteobacteria bacterium]|tara:strand:- start:4484 stop:5863 length:1380 start_codon:yes stop_codon:yes gene_type:complete